MATVTSGSPGLGNVRRSDLPFIPLASYGFSPSRTAASNRSILQDAISSLPLNTDNESLNPKGYAQGGTIALPPGLCSVGGGRINLQRGVRIVGCGRESTQLVCTNADGLFLYEDDGGYAPDDLVFKSFAIWQDENVTATSGASIQIEAGNASTIAVSLSARDLYLEGMYHGIKINGLIASDVQRSVVSKTVSHGIYGSDGSGDLMSTSTSLISVYTNQCGGSGVFLKGADYVSMIGCASDTNTRYGYELEGVRNLSVHGGAEANVLGGAKLTTCTGANLVLTVVDNEDHDGDGVVLDACPATRISGVMSSDAASTGYAINVVNSTTGVFCLGLAITAGSWATTNLCNNTANIFSFNPVAGRFHGGINKQWSFGAEGVPPTTNQLSIAGTADSGVSNGVVSDPSFVSAGTSNSAIKAIVRTANTAVTYAVAAGVYIANAVKGAASTITRSYGLWIEEQTTGGNANANLLLGNSAAAVGNWDTYSSSTRDSVWMGKHRFLSSTGPFLFFGAGTPEAAITAPVGSIYGRTDGGAGSSFYVKESGSGNTGWVAK